MREGRSPEKKRSGEECQKLVPKAGIEPARCFAPADFESAASTYFATSAEVLNRKLWHSLGYELPNH